MPTNQASETNRRSSDSQRDWMIFAFHGFARIVARKHGLVVPDVDLSQLSDEDLEQRYNVVRELAHLPPA